MRSSALCLLFVLASAGVANAQTYQDLRIQLEAYVWWPDGGEKPAGVSRSTGPVVIGAPVRSTFSLGDACDRFQVSSDDSVIDGATTVWKIETTAVRVVGNAVTFRLRWVRLAAGLQMEQFSFESGNGTRIPEEVELTLRPGESWPVDPVRVLGAKTIPGRPCAGEGSIRVSVESNPWEEEERRLVVADLWLVERLPDGGQAQRGGPISVRGLPNRPFRFYFDSIVESKVALDMYGILVARLGADAIFVTIETRSRWSSGPQNTLGPQHSVTSDVEVKPAETVEIRLPLLGDHAGPFAKRAYSIRIRVRQLR